MKWRGKIGYVETVQVTPGEWKPRITERTYSGEVIKHAFGWSQTQDSTNDDLTISNSISVIADSFSRANFNSMKYVEFMGVKWKITSADIQYPRIVLTLGGVWNG